MGLQDAVQEIVARMEARGDKYAKEGHEILSLTIGSFVDQLKTALKASEGTSSASSFPINDDLSATAFHHRMVEQARLEMKKSKSEQEVNKEESYGDSMRECVGGPANGDMVVVDPTMPVGANMYVLGKVYQLREDGKLHYDEPPKSNILLP